MGAYDRYRLQVLKARFAANADNEGLHCFYELLPIPLLFVFLPVIPKHIKTPTWYQQALVGHQMYKRPSKELSYDVEV